jgi:hypothetical protein
MTESILPSVLTVLLLVALYSMAYRKRRTLADDLRFRIKVGHAVQYHRYST